MAEPLPSTPDTENEWIFNGSPEAFEQFLSDRLEQLRPRLMRIAYKYVRDAASAEDVVGEALFRAWRMRHSFAASGGHLLKWMATIVFHCFADTYKARRRMPEAPEQQIVVADRARAVDAALGDRAELAIAMDCIDRLPAEQRQYLLDHLFEFEGEALSRIALKHGKTRQNVSALVLKALAAVRDCVRARLSPAGAALQPSGGAL
jgi:RNA polymerase sigma factor (sigma-70 family)